MQSYSLVLIVISNSDKFLIYRSDVQYLLCVVIVLCSFALMLFLTLFV